jgi:hypothetical protein
MADVNGGGAAFPRQAHILDWGNGADSEYYAAQAGMSLRDYFAGQAMTAPWGEALSVDQQGFTNDPDTFAANCYALADAMLKAREATHGA